VLFDAGLGLVGLGRGKRRSEILQLVPQTRKLHAWHAMLGCQLWVALWGLEFSMVLLVWQAHGCVQPLD
jgi:hypothetical protein